MSTNRTESDQHYAPGDIEAAVTAALAQRNGAPPLTLHELAPLDQFHTGGVQATRSLAQRAAIAASDRVLDVGGGIGGPARLLAQEIGCQVTVLDLTEAYCRVGARLTTLTGLDDRVHFQEGDALEMPFSEGSFDVAWTQHSSMNIPDKAGLYAQIHRVLRPGGRLAIHEVVIGSGEPIHLPTMWAHTAALNFIVPPDTLRAAAIGAGFREIAWEDTSEQAVAWFGRTPSNAAQNPLGLHLLLGSDFRTLIGNHVRNLQEGRARIVEAIFARA
jgi:SAM-dependent methyltransferase